MSNKRSNVPNAGAPAPTRVTRASSRDISNDRVKETPASAAKKARTSPQQDGGSISAAGSPQPKTKAKTLVVKGDIPGTPTPSETERQTDVPVARAIVKAMVDQQAVKGTQVASPTRGSSTPKKVKASHPSPEAEVVSDIAKIVADKDAENPPSPSQPDVSIADAQNPAKTADDIQTPVDGDYTMEEDTEEAASDVEGMATDRLDKGKGKETPTVTVVDDFGDQLEMDVATRISIDEGVTHASSRERKAIREEFLIKSTEDEEQEIEEGKVRTLEGKEYNVWEVDDKDRETAKPKTLSRMAEAFYEEADVVMTDNAQSQMKTLRLNGLIVVPAGTFPTPEIPHNAHCFNISALDRAHFISRDDRFALLIVALRHLYYVSCLGATTGALSWILEQLGMKDRGVIKLRGLNPASDTKKPLVQGVIIFGLNEEQYNYLLDNPFLLREDKKYQSFFVHDFMGYIPKFVACIMNLQVTDSEEGHNVALAVCAYAVRNSTSIISFLSAHEDEFPGQTLYGVLESVILSLKTRIFFMAGGNGSQDRYITHLYATPPFTSPRLYVPWRNAFRAITYVMKDMEGGIGKASTVDHMCRTCSAIDHPQGYCPFVTNSISPYYEPPRTDRRDTRSSTKVEEVQDVEEGSSAMARAFAMEPSSSQVTIDELRNQAAGNKRKNNGKGGDARRPRNKY